MNNLKQEINRAYQLYNLQQVLYKDIYQILDDYHFAKLITDEQYEEWKDMDGKALEIDFAQWVFGNG